MMKHIISDIDGVLAENDKIPNEIKKIILEIQELIPFSIATGRSFKEVRELGLTDIIKNGFLILENGSIILPKNNLIKKWEEEISLDMEELNDLFEKVDKEKYSLIVKKERSFGVREFKDLELLEKYPNLKSLENFGDFDIVSKKAGKENAINYLVKNNFIEKEFACIGNGDNDLGMLKLSSKPFTVADASKNVLTHVKKQGFVSSKPSTEGTKEILKLVLSQLQNI